MYLRRRFAGLVAAGPGAGAASARYFQGHGEGSCRHDRHAGRPGSGFARRLGQEFVRRDEYCMRQIEQELTEETEKEIPHLFL